MEENPNCGCKRNCPRHGKCTLCRQQHEHSRYKTFCQREADKAMKRSAKKAEAAD